jgi:hypothetical protein
MRAHDLDLLCWLFDSHPTSVYSLTALRWLSRFEAALATLAVNPQRCSLAPENDAVDEEIRQFLFGKRGASVFRALFTIADGEVRVLHIRRAVMDTATRDELYG